MTSYGARILDRSSGRFIFTAPGVRSPHRVGQVVAGAFSVLIGRDGFDEADLELRSFVDDEGRLRPMDVTEEGEMNTAFQDFVAQTRRVDPRRGTRPVPGSLPPWHPAERLDDHAA